MTTLFAAFAKFVDNHFGLYLATCFAIGLLIRWHWAAGDIGKFLSPLFPLIQ